MNSNQKNLLNFLSNETMVKKLPFYEKLQLNEVEVFFLKFVTEKYIYSQINEFTIGTVLEEFNAMVYEFLAYDKKKSAIVECFKYDENNLEKIRDNDRKLEYISKNDNPNNFILLLDNVKNILGEGWIGLYQNFLDEVPDSIYLTAKIYLTKDFLFLIEKNELNNNIGKDFLSSNNYSNYQEYINDKFLYLDLLYKQSLLEETGVKSKATRFQHNLDLLKKVETKIEEKEMISNIKEYPLNKFIEEFNFNKLEEMVLLCLLKEEYDNKSEYSGNLREEENILSVLKYLDTNVNTSIFDFEALTDEQTILYDEVLDNYEFKMKRNYFLSTFIMDRIRIEENLSKLNKDKNDKILLDKMNNISKRNNGIFEIITPNVSIEKVSINKEVKDIIEILTIQKNEENNSLLAEWGIKKLDEEINTNIIFYGKPGTGKTLSAYLIGTVLNKKVLVFDCSKILAMYVGESEKNVRMIFDTYREIVKETGEYPILLLNEADQFLGTRSSGNNSSTEKMQNQMQNIFLEQIENFKGILIATTNLLENLDKAFSRRFNYKIKFDLPSMEQRKEIWNNLIPKKAQYEENFNIEELLKFELSGGQIDLIIKNTALKVVIKDEKIFTLNDFITETKKELGSAFDNNKTVGFFS